MSDYDNTNSGALFKNDKGENAKRPDYKGLLNVNGVDHWISAWLKKDKSGKSYMSLSVQLKKEQPAKQANPPAPDFDDEIPF